MKQGLSWFGLVAAVSCALSACGGATVGERDGAGSETDWLSLCRNDDECDVGACHCGICTKVCEANVECESLAASCLHAEELLDCDAAPAPNEGICVDDAAIADVEMHLDPNGTIQLEEALATSALGRVEHLQLEPNEKVDLLFTIDNSLMMGEKQMLLSQALPDLVTRLVDPACISADGQIQPSSSGSCGPGFRREFQPIDDIHIGVITSSLGGFGSELDCTREDEGETDNSHLLGSLMRVRSDLPGTPPFLSWCRPGSDAEANGSCVATAETSGGDAFAFSTVFADQVRAAGEQGCGWEASLEAWYRFLVEPYPWTRVARQNCPFGGDVNQLCVGPETDAATGLPFVDDVVLQQRRDFLRADSVLAIVMLTDENDCSFKASGQTWRLSQTFRLDSSGEQVPSRAYRAASVCSTSPNDVCCVSCGSGVPQGCSTAVNDEGEMVSAGCENPIYESADDLAAAGSDAGTDDAVNLRCFDQKRRFGVDYLYPVARYSNALKNVNLCPFADDIAPNAVGIDGSQPCGENQEYLVANPLYIDLGYEARLAADPNAVPVAPRDPSRVFLAGILGVPWQDLAVDRGAATLEYRSNHPDYPPTIDWTQLLGSADVGAPYDLLEAPPTDPLMREQLEPRAGTDTSVNGGEWNILDKDDLQYACTFPLSEPVDCPSLDDLEAGVTVACDCTYYGNPAYENPLCAGDRQTHAKAYPSIRPLQVLRDFGSNSIVASICPRNIADPTSTDWGYRPAMNALIERMKSAFQPACLAEELPLHEVDGEQVANCLVVEVTRGGGDCDVDAGRREVDAELDERVRQRLQLSYNCQSVEDDCRQFHSCTIDPFAPGTDEYESCLESETPSGDGWCYIDIPQGLGDEATVENCSAAEKRRLRFAGDATPRSGAVALLVCEED